MSSTVGNAYKKDGKVSPDDIIIEDSSGTKVFLKTPVDRSTLKVGDYVEFVDRNQPASIIYPTETDSQPYVKEISNNEVTVEVPPEARILTS